MSGMTMFSMGLIRNPQCPLSTPLLDPPILDTLIIVISTQNFQGIFLGVKKTSFMTSGMTLSSMYPVRNPQHPPSTPLLDPPFLPHFSLRYKHKIFRVSSLG